jgi:hypothetical protein
LYLAAMEGIFAAQSPYLSWTRVDPDPQPFDYDFRAGASQSVIGTPNYLYASFGWASLGTLDPEIRRAPTSTGTSWNRKYAATPGAMTNGAMGAAVTFNGTNYIVVTGNWRGGIWRFEEPATTSSSSRCDVNRDNAININDVQVCVNQAIQSVSCTTGDINSDGNCTVIDVQRVVNAILGNSCVIQ